MGQARKVTPSSVKKNRASSMFFAKKVDLKEEIEAEKGDTPQKCYYSDPIF